MSIKSLVPSAYARRSVIPRSSVFVPLLLFVPYKPLFPSWGSQIQLVLQYQFFSIPVQMPESNARASSSFSSEIKSKLSADVWYSGYEPYFERHIAHNGKSTPGEQYCLSSEPLSQKEYFLKSG